METSRESSQIKIRYRPIRTLKSGGLGGKIVSSRTFLAEYACLKIYCMQVRYMYSYSSYCTKI